MNFKRYIGWALLALLALGIVPASAQDDSDAVPPLAESFSEGNLQFNYPSGWIIQPEVFDNDNVVVLFGSDQAAIDQSIVPAGELFGIVITLNNPVGATDIELVSEAVIAQLQASFNLPLSAVEVQTLDEARTVALATWQETAGDGVVYVWAADSDTAVVVLYIAAAGEGEQMQPLLEALVMGIDAGAEVAASNAASTPTAQEDGQAQDAADAAATLGGYTYTAPSDWVEMDAPLNLDIDILVYANGEALAERLQPTIEDETTTALPPLESGEAVLVTMLLPLPQGLALTEEDFASLFSAPPPIDGLTFTAEEQTTLGEYSAFRFAFSDEEENEGWFYVVLLEESVVLNVALYGATDERDAWQATAETFIASFSK